MFFTSLITPLILLVLYITFLGNVYRDSFSSALPPSFQIPEKLINATVGGELVSSLLAVCCVTVAFCSNLLMISDRVNGAAKDLAITPVRPFRRRARVFHLDRALHPCDLHDGARRIVHLSFAHGLVSVGIGCPSADTRCDPARALRHGAVVCRDVSAHDLRSGLGGRNRSQRGIRLHMRSIYADLKLRIRTSARNFVSLPERTALPFSEIIRSAEPSPR